MTNDQPRRRAIPPAGWNTIEQVATICGVSEDRVRKWLHSGKLEYKNDRTDVSCKQHLISDDALSRCAPAMRMLLAKLKDGPPGEPFEETYVGNQLYVDQVPIEQVWSAIRSMSEPYVSDTTWITFDQYFKERGPYAVQRILNHLLCVVGHQRIFDPIVSEYYVKIMEEWRDRMGDMRDWNIGLEYGTAEWRKLPPMSQWIDDHGNSKADRQEKPRPKNPFE